MDLDKATYDSQTQPMQSHINVGFGSDVTIAELAAAVANATGYQGKIGFDPSKPDGAPRKWMSSNKLNMLGWVPRVSMELGLQNTYHEILEQKFMTQ